MSCSLNLKRIVVVLVLVVTKGGVDWLAWSDRNIVNCWGTAVE